MTKKILFLLMPLDYKDVEFYEPYKILKEKNFEVDVANIGQGVATGADGYEFMPNLTLSKMEEKDFDKYDALVIPGGPGSSKYLWDNEEILSIIKNFHNNKKIVAAICHAVGVIAQSGILENKKATIYPSEDAKQILKENNVKNLDKGVVCLEKDKIITAQGPDYAKEFGEEISKLLKD